MNLIREIILTDARFINASTEIYLLSYVRFWIVSQLFYNLQLGQAFGWKVYSTIINESSLGNSVRSFDIVINNVLLIIYKYKYHGKVLSVQLCCKPPASLTQHKTLNSGCTYSRKPDPTSVATQRVQTLQFSLDIYIIYLAWMRPVEFLHDLGCPLSA